MSDGSEARDRGDEGDKRALIVAKDKARSRRRRPVRARTISVKRMSKRELEIGRILYPEDEHDVERPRTRAECKDGVRPCPFVACQHHLYLDVSAKTGAIKVNFPDIPEDELEQLSETCALDVADHDGATLEEVGAHLNLTRERVRQLEVKALAKLLANGDMRLLRDVVDGGKPRDKRRRRLPLLDELDPDHFASEELDDDDDAD